MTLALTPFGWIFVPLAVLVLWRWRAGFPGLLMFAAVPQASSVFDVALGSAVYGVSPYAFAAALASPLLLAGVLRGRPPWPEPGAQHRSAGWLLAYFAIAALGALLLPHVYSGVAVHALDSKLGFDAPPVPLEFGLSHAAQAINCAVHLVVLCFLLQSVRSDPRQAQHALLGLATGIALVVAIGIYERLAFSGWWPSGAEFWMSNRGYAQGHGANVAGLLRVSAPFSEPSYGSSLLAAACAGAFAVVVFGRRVALAAGACVLLGLALLNTFGSTGLGALAIAAGALLLLVGLRSCVPPARAYWRRRALWLYLAASLVAGGVGWTVLRSPIADTASRVLEKSVFEKLGGDHSLSTIARRHSNLHAVQVARETNGLGAGFGSNRASSFLASLASNGGAPALLLYLAALASVFAGLHRAPRTDATRFAATALATASIAMWIGIPDLNLPFYWAFVFVALLLASAPPAGVAGGGGTSSAASGATSGTGRVGQARDQSGSSTSATSGSA